MKVKALPDLKHLQAESIKNPTQLIECHQLGITFHVTYELVVIVNLPNISYISNSEQYWSPYNSKDENCLFYLKQFSSYY